MKIKWKNLTPILLATLSTTLSLAACQKSCEHDLIQQEEVPATCTEDGIAEHWQCSICEAYFSDAEGKNETSLDLLKLNKRGHTDDNSDLICDDDGAILLSVDQLQTLIEATLSSVDVRVDRKIVHSADNSYYYVENNLIYINDDSGETYISKDGDVNYAFTKGAGEAWEKQTVEEEITYTAQYAFCEAHNLEIDSELFLEEGVGYEDEDIIIFCYQNTDGIHVGFLPNENVDALKMLFIFDQGGNYITTYTFTFGKNAEIGEKFNEIDK